MPFYFKKIDQAVEQIVKDIKVQEEKVMPIVLKSYLINTNNKLITEYRGWKRWYRNWIKFAGSFYRRLGGQSLAERMDQAAE